MNRFSGISSLLISLALLTACTSNPRVQSDFDDSVDFSQYKTYNFGSQTEVLDPDFHDVLGLTFSAATEEQMRSRGYVKSDNPDVLINVSVDVEDKTQAPSQGRQGYGCPGYGGRSTYISSNYNDGKGRSTFCRYTEGSIKIDMIDLKLNRAIWDGVSFVRFDERERGEMLASFIMRDVDTMFESSPFSARLSPLFSVESNGVGENQSGYVADSTVPDPFKGFDPSSTQTIDYDVLTQWLEYLVVDIGRSDRRSADVRPPLGTRIAPKVKKATLFEGNRFFFESFEDNEKARQVLRDVRDSLEQIPASMPLEYFSRDEQLAYWLNLYNFTILTEIVEIYPTRDLEDFLVGENSILSKKLLTVADIPLSLNDIQFTILKENYGNDPLISYGLYQGIIGGPNIRKEAYTGATVYRALELNAIEFINSNRGTNKHNKKHKVQKVSSLYARNKSYFPDFNTDLSAHLLEYIEGDGRKRGLAKAKATLKPEINDWTVTDLWGTFPEVRSGIANRNPAALMGAIVGTGVPSSAYLSMVGNPYSPILRTEIFKYLLTLNMKRVRTNEKNATVTMEELGEFPVNPEADEEDKDN
ncbi:MAG: DUF4136 domain-containing protein [Xanthomonadales bacterium]|nr:DUF4136 domain-containing protein [Xanthomonadales bacterium]